MTGGFETDAVSGHARRQKGVALQDELSALLSTLCNSVEESRGFEDARNVATIETSVEETKTTRLIASGIKIKA